MSTFLALPVVALSLHLSGAGPGALAPTLGDGLDVDELGRVDSALVKALAVDGAARSRAASSRAGLACELVDVDCLVQLAVALDADRIIAGRARGVPGKREVSLELRLVDVATAAVTARAVRPLDPGALERSAAAAVAALSSPEAKASSLTVDTAAGAEIVVDGKSLGVAPLASPVPLPAGKHVVEVRAADGTGRADVDVLLGEVTRVTLAPDGSSLSPSSSSSGALSTAATPTRAAPPAEPSAVPWVAVGAGALALAVGGGLAMVGALPYLDLTSAADELDTLDGQLSAEGAPPATPAQLAQIDAAHARYTAGVDAWSTWGEALVLVGVATIGAGVAATAVGAAWALE